MKYEFFRKIRKEKFNNFFFLEINHWMQIYKFFLGFIDKKSEIFMKIVLALGKWGESKKNSPRDLYKILQTC